MRTSRSPLSLVSTLAFAALLPTAALAQTAAAPAAATPPAPDYTLTANAGLFSEYIFRGIAQTAGKPAVQGGFDWAHSSGFYLGTWASNISWLEDFGAYTRSSLEWDFYGGYKNNFPGSEDFGYNVGTLYYYYPGSRNPGFANANTWELYAALNWKWLGAKASYSLDNYFGAKPVGKKTDGTWYFDFYANYPIGEAGMSCSGTSGSSTSQTTEAGTARPRTTTGNWGLRMGCRTGRSREWRSARTTAATMPRKPSTPTLPATTPRRTPSSSTSRRRSERGPTLTR